MSALADIVLARVTPALAEQFADTSTLESVLKAMFDAGRSQWPEVPVEPEVFVAFVADRLGEADGLDTLTKLYPADLYLACGCVLGDPVAISALEKTSIDNLGGALHELDQGTGLTAEVQQRVRTKLLTAEEGQLPAIAGFRGRGTLKSWIRTIGIRIGYDLLGKSSKQVELKDTHMAGATGDLELEYFKSKYREHFSAAFADALSVLSSRERTLLRMSVIDGLSCAQLGVMYKKDKSTVSRWLSTAREKLADQTKNLLKERLNLSPSEVDSVIRMVRSRIDMSVRNLFLSQHT